MFIELHILQNFAPSNLNRDDTGSPKDCDFGGFRRARISSQCIKRALRTHSAFEKAVQATKGDLGVRTKRILEALVTKLVEDWGHPKENCPRVAENILKGARIKLEKEQKTQYLLYLGKNEIAGLARIAHQHWDELSAVQNPDDASSDKKKTGSKAKREQQETIPPEIRKEIDKVLGQTTAADIALFGRMVADDSNKNINAACQVAHAISTHEVKMEMDYYTAIDDLLPGEETGSDMIGMIDFNSSCFYRYAQVNLDLLNSTLSGDKDLVSGTIRGFLEASVLAIPTGKQNSMAAQNLPSYVRVLVRSEGAPWSLANAFLQPIRPGKGEREDLVSKSVNALEDHLSRVKRMYGSNGILTDLTSSMLPERENLSLKELIDEVINHLNQQES